MNASVVGMVVVVTGCAVDLASDEAELTAEQNALIASTRASIAQRGITAIPKPPPNIRPALVELGRALAFDKILSGNHDVSCMSCHPPALGTDDDRHVSFGVTGIGLGVGRMGDFIAGEEGRNAPSLFNMHALQTLFWDGRVAQLPNGDFVTPAGAQLTAQMKAVAEFGAISVLPMFPVTSRDEMRGYGTSNELASLPDTNLTAIWARLMVRLGAIPKYRQMFEMAYPGTKFQHMTFAHAANAIGAFIVARFHAVESPWDRFLRGHDSALSLEALRGAEIFVRTCVNCHSGSTGSDQLFHNTALAQIGPGPRSGGDGPSGRDDFGRMRVTGDPVDAYAFRTTPLRNVEHTAPFGHAGQIVDLEDFIRHYAVRIENGAPVGSPPGPAQNRREYDVMQIEARLTWTLIDNADDVIDAIDPLFVTGSPIQPAFVGPLTAFMRANTDAQSIVRLQNVTPNNVPSGLPVAD